MVSSFKQLTINMKSLLDMQLGVGIKTVEDWILNLGAEVYKAQYDLDSLAQIRDNNLGLLKILMNTTDPPEFNAQYGLLLTLFSIFNDPGFFFMDRPGLCTDFFHLGSPQFGGGRGQI